MEEEGSSSGVASGSDDADAEAAAVMARFSLDVSAGCGARHSTLLDEYERLAFEAQLNRAIVLRRCYSEPSPVRFVDQHPRSDAPPPALCGAGHQGQAPRHERAAAGRLFWRVHEVVARLLWELEPVLRWLRSAWERRRRTTERALDTVPRVRLMDYLR
ncbi:hypothetical protein QOZ80_5AG0369570 [Eleusine coracana subsp. coracana]|nr:hypothetical protein QOZ80_5AG0369570 [Eleusine coracana subsp. coracana]